MQANGLKCTLVQLWRHSIQYMLEWGCLPWLSIITLPAPCPVEMLVELLMRGDWKLPSACSGSDIYIFSTAHLNSNAHILKLSTVPLTNFCGSNFLVWLQVLPPCPSTQSSFGPIRKLTIAHVHVRSIVKDTRSSSLSCRVHCGDTRRRRLTITYMQCGGDTQFNTH